MAEINQPPYPTVLKPYGQSLVALAKEREDVVCLTGDLSKQCEIDLFADAYPERFIYAGMAEANMMGVAGALARDGFVPYVHTFGAFATRRPLDQVINAIAFPNLKQGMEYSFARCVCTDPGECSSVCGGNYCTGGAATEACDACMRQSTICAPAGGFSSV